MMIIRIMKLIIITTMLLIITIMITKSTQRAHTSVKAIGH